MAKILCRLSALGDRRSPWPFRVFVWLLGLHGALARRADPPWTYENQWHWQKDYQNCKGNYQSPIDINTETLIENRKSGSLDFGPGYMVKPDTSTILNTGHTAMINVKVNGKATVSGGPLPHGKYKFEQLHFHWGRNDSVGSEHTLDGRRFPLELHLVHYNEAYHSFKKALGKKDGILVLAVWFQLDNHKVESEKDVLDPIISSLPGTMAMGDTCRIKTQQRLFDLLPRNQGTYFHYTGSLTTPPCTENVLWVVFAAKQNVNSKQMQAFRRLREYSKRADCDTLISSNFRKLQPLHKRRVFRVIRPANHDR